MREPLIWVWLSTFTRLVVMGDPYLLLRRWQLREALFIAGVVYRACRSIRQFPTVTHG